MKPLKYLAQFLLLAGVLLGLDSCYKHYLITIGISKALADYYNIYPSIEVDITAVPSSMADEIKTAGVESYFAPDSRLRVEAAPYTVRFSEEITAPVTLTYRELGWRKWVKKKPDKLVLLVNLPYSAEMKSADGRILTIDIKERFIQWQDIYFEIGPKQIAEVPEKPVDPRRARSNIIPTNK
ncbi:hypothetical protein AGMMS50268_23070 [Spirochaetia bacterium]|nr:hypothetical protein AGMMS50268_23070 [Spirochaetia bacterium]